MNLLATATLIHINAALLSLASGVVIPLFVSLLAKANAPATVKVLLNAGLSAVAGAITTAAVAGGAVIWQTWLLNMALAFMASTTAYFGGLKPAGVTAVVETKTARFGVGRTPPPPKPAKTTKAAAKRVSSSTK